MLKDAAQLFRLWVWGTTETQRTLRSYFFCAEHTFQVVAYDAASQATASQTVKVKVEE